MVKWVSGGQFFPLLARSGLDKEINSLDTEAFNKTSRHHVPAVDEDEEDEFKGE